jgi:CRP-like cAMP-binding protein
MALLDGAPRLASATTALPTRLLRLDQEPFYELMDDRIEIAHGIIQVLNQRLRASITRLRQARTVQTGAVEPHVPTITHNPEQLNSMGASYDTQ